MKRFIIGLFWALILTGFITVVAYWFTSKGLCELCKHKGVAIVYTEQPRILCKEHAIKVLEELK